MTNFKATLKEYDDKNNGEFDPINPATHNQPNSYGTVIHTNILGANPLGKPQGICIEEDCLSTDKALILTNEDDSKNGLPEGTAYVQNPYSENGKVVFYQDRVEVSFAGIKITLTELLAKIVAFNSEVVLEQDLVSAKVDDTSINIEPSQISLDVGSVNVVNFTPAGVIFNVPISNTSTIPSTLNDKQIAVVGGVTQGTGATRPITVSGQP